MKKGIATYIISKFTGASFLILVIVLFGYFGNVTGNRSLFDLSEMLQENLLWFVTFVYGVLASFLIDYIVTLTKVENKGRVGFYILAGYLFFLLQGFHAVMVIAGTIGAICAVIFLIGTKILKRFFAFGLVLTFVVPVVMLTIALIDFTEKEQWTAQQEETSYSANFAYFNGKHEIPLELEAGEAIQIQHTFDNTNEGGHGFHVKDRRNKHVGLKVLPNEAYQLTATYDGTYRIIITGNQVRGNFTVDWEKINNEKES